MNIPKTLPGIDPALTTRILDRAYARTDLHSEADGLPIIGEVFGLTYHGTSANKELAREMFGVFPLLYHNISLTLHAVTGLPPAYPTDLAPPAIMLDRAIPDIPSLYLDLISGELGLTPPPGPCAQFKMQIAARSCVLFS